MERRLKLVNKNDETLDFMEVENFGHSPEGLGLEMDNVVYQAYSSFTNVQLNIKRNEIKLKITAGAFSDKPYATFFDILKFLNVGGLKLYYDVPDIGEFIRDVSFQKITKSDAAEYHVLQEEMDLFANTPWYTWETIAEEQDPVFGAGKIYDDEYSIAPNDQLIPNWEYIATEDNETAPLPVGVIAGEGSKYGPFGGTQELHEYNVVKWCRFTVTGTANAGFRFDTSQYTPGLKVKTGDLFRVEYFIKNDSTAAYAMNFPVYARDETGTLKTMGLLNSTDPTSINIPNDNKWHKVTGSIYKATFDGYSPLGYAYQAPTQAIGSTGIVAGFKMSRVTLTDNAIVGGDYNWNSLPNGNIIDSSAGGENVVVNFEDIAGTTPITTLPPNTGLTLGGGSDFVKIDIDDSLQEYGFTKYGSIKGKAAPTAQAGFRFDSRVYKPNTEVKKGSLWKSTFLVRNTFTEPITINANIAYHDGTATGAQTNMKPISGSLDPIIIPNDGAWHLVDGQILSPGTDGIGPIGYAYTHTKALTQPNITFDVAGIQTIQVANNNKVGDWQAWASGSSWLTTVNLMDDAENILSIDGDSTTSFLRTNIADALPVSTTVNTKFRAKLSFNDGVDTTIADTPIFSIALYSKADALKDFTISDDTILPYDIVTLRSTGVIENGTKIAAKLVGDVPDFNDNDWHDIEIEFNVGADNNFAYSTFYKQLPGFTYEIQNYTIMQKGGSVQKEADGPYSVISPRTTIYQIDYTKISPLLDIHNDSMYFGTQTDSSMRITIRAKDKVIENPKWLLRDMNMTIKQSEGYNLKIDPGNYLVVSSDPFERYTRLYDGDDDTYQDVSTAIDPSTQGWIRIPVGDSRLELDTALAAATQGFGGPNITVEYKKEWLVV